MIDASQIKEHMKVKGSDGQHVGTVDHMEGGRIKLAKSDPASGGQHHFLDLGLVDEVKNGEVCLNKSAADAKRMWQ